MSAAIPTRPISLERLKRVMLPISQATGLPNEAYTSAEHFQRERDEVIGRTWAGLVFADSLPDRPFAQPVDFMGLPLLVTRDRGGELRVFHNVCSHRGMQLVQAPTEVQGVIRCPYHSWTYDISGNLKGTPHIGGVNQHKCDGFDQTQHGLRPVRSTVWMGVVFINLSGDAPEFADSTAALRERIERFIGRTGWSSLGPGVSGGKMSLGVKCNWKLAVENHCEAYHLPWVHPALNTYSRLEDHYNVLGYEGFSGQGSLAYRLSDVAGTKLPCFEQWPADKLCHAEYFSLYPNVLLGFQADHVYAIILTPQGPGATHEELRLSFVGDGATSDTYQVSRAATLEAWRVVFSEDVFAVEGMQQGRASPAYQGGVFSPEMDQPTHHFHAWVAQRLAETTAARGV